MNTENGRFCAVCNKQINHRRADAKTCHTNCRSALYRRQLSQRVLVRFNCPLDLYTNLAVLALGAGVGIDAYLSKIVSKLEGSTFFKRVTA